MFTGIIEEIGIIRAINGSAVSLKITISANIVTQDLKAGDSVCVNGVCLTVTAHSPGIFTADVMHETLSRSSLGKLRTGSRVNLERAVYAQGRFGGHFVTGHIDGTGIVESVITDGIARIYTFTVSETITAGIVCKGSIAVNGVSLTVTSIGKTYFSVSVIPHTLKNTVTELLKPGDIVNIETDYLGKYIAKYFQKGSANGIQYSRTGS